MNRVIVTREIAPIPKRADDAHKGDVGRIVVIGGRCDEVVMVGAPTLAANAAFRSGAGLVQLLVPEAIRAAVAVLSPCSTVRTLPCDTSTLLQAVADFGADVAIIGPGLGDSLEPAIVATFLREFGGMIVVDADALNLLSLTSPFAIPQGKRVVLTPHPGEARRLLASCGKPEIPMSTPSTRQEAALALVRAYACVVVLKGRGTVVTDGARAYVNETGNSGMATGGAGDVLAGIIAALMGQRLASLEAAILGTYLHGLAGDFAAEEIGRCSMIADDIVDYLPEAFREHETADE